MPPSPITTHTEVALPSGLVFARRDAVTWHCIAGGRAATGFLSTMAALAAADRDGFAEAVRATVGYALPWCVEDGPDRLGIADALDRSGQEGGPGRLRVLVPENADRYAQRRSRGAIRGVLDTIVTNHAIAMETPYGGIACFSGIRETYAGVENGHLVVRRIKDDGLRVPTDEASVILRGAAGQGDRWRAGCTEAFAHYLAILLSSPAVQGRSLVAMKAHTARVHARLDALREQRAPALEDVRC